MRMWLGFLLEVQVLSESSSKERTWSRIILLYKIFSTPPRSPTASLRSSSPHEIVPMHYFFQRKQKDPFGSFCLCAEESFSLHERYRFHIVLATLRAIYSTSSSPLRKLTLSPRTIKAPKGFYFVRGRGLEPPQVTLLVPKTNASTNFATRAGVGTSIS